MIRHAFSIQEYWKVVVYYNVDYSFSSVIRREMLENGFSREFIDGMLDTMQYDGAKGVTCTNADSHICFVLLNRHASKADYISTIVHEAEHVKQSMLEAYGVEDAGEAPAYALGYIISQMYTVFKFLVCDSCDTGNG